MHHQFGGEDGDTRHPGGHSSALGKGLRKPMAGDLGPMMHQRHQSYRIADRNNFEPYKPQGTLVKNVSRPALNRKISGMDQIDNVSKLKFMTMNNGNSNAIHEPMLSDEFSYTIKQSGLTPSDQMRVTSKFEQYQNKLLKLNITSSQLK